MSQMVLKAFKHLKTVQYLNEKYPDHFTIADAKRGDIGNTSTQYAKAFFEKLPFDSVTVAPYMGRDSIEPFLQFKDKYAILLVLIKSGAYDFQTLNNLDRSLYETIIANSRTWKGSERLMYVLGATKSEYLANVRALAPKSFFLIPGVGAQGGDLASVFHAAANEDIGLLVNSSRSIIFASSGDDYADAARMAAMDLQHQMKTTYNASLFYTFASNVQSLGHFCAWGRGSSSIWFKQLREFSKHFKCIIVRSKRAWKI